MQAKNNFSSSLSFNIFYLVESHKSVTHTTRLSPCKKVIAVRGAYVDGLHP